MADPTLDTSKILEKDFLELLQDTDNVVSMSDKDRRSEKAKLIKEKRHEIFKEAAQALYERYKPELRVTKVGYRLVRGSATIELFVLIDNVTEKRSYAAEPPLNRDKIDNPFIFESSVLQKKVQLNVAIDVNATIPPKVKTDEDCLKKNPLYYTILALRRTLDPPFEAGQALYRRPNDGSWQLGNDIDAGTLGGWVKDLENNEPVILSNLHVLSHAPIAIYSIRTIDLINWTEASPIFERGRFSSKADCAIAKPASADFIPDDVKKGAGFRLNLLNNTPLIKNKAEAKIGDRVLKVGQTTGLTRGVIESCYLFVGGPQDNVPGFSVYSPEYFCSGGDSGSLIVKDAQHDRKDGTSRRVLGLLWGGDFPNPNFCNYDTVANAFPIDFVCTQLKIDIY